MTSPRCEECARVMCQWCGERTYKNGEVRAVNADGDHEIHWREGNVSKVRCGGNFIRSLNGTARQEAAELVAVKQEADPAVAVPPAPTSDTPLTDAASAEDWFRRSGGTAMVVVGHDEAAWNFARRLERTANLMREALLQPQNVVRRNAAIAAVAALKEKP